MNKVANQPPEYTPITAWWLASVLCIAGLVAYIARLILSSLLDPIRSELQISDSEVSVLQGAAFAIVYAFAALPLGRLVDRRRRLTILTVSAGAWSVGVIGCGLAPGFWPLFACRLLVGVGEAALIPAGTSLLADAFPIGRRGIAISILMVGCALGVPAASALGGVLLHLAQVGTFLHVLTLGQISAWRQVLVLIGMGSMIVPLLLLSSREPSRKVGVEASASVPATVARLWQERTLLVPLYLGMGTLSVGDFALYSWVPSLLSRQFSFAPEIGGLWFGGIAAIASIAGLGLGGALSDWAERHGGLTVRIAISAVATGVTSLSALLLSGPRSGFVLIGVGIWIFASAVSFANAFVALQTVIPAQHRGLGASLVSFFNILLGLGLGPTLVALTTEYLFVDPKLVGFSITAVATCSGLLACAGYTYLALLTRGARGSTE
jgi:MFS family permease